MWSSEWAGLCSLCKDRGVPKPPMTRKPTLDSGKTVPSVIWSSIGATQSWVEERRLFFGVQTQWKEVKNQWKDMRINMSRPPQLHNLRLFGLSLPDLYATWPTCETWHLHLSPWKVLMVFRVLHFGFSLPFASPVITSGRFRCCNAACTRVYAVSEAWPWWGMVSRRSERDFPQNIYWNFLSIIFCIIFWQKAQLNGQILKSTSLAHHWHNMFFWGSRRPNAMASRLNVVPHSLAGFAPTSSRCSFGASTKSTKWVPQRYIGDHPWS